MDAAELITALRPHVPDALIATDFDGTLAPLTPDPQDSRPVPGAVAALSALADRGAQVAVITGRDARTVVRLGGLTDVPGLIVAGLYGLETWHDGDLVSPDTPPSIEALRRRLPDAVRGGDPALWIEDKRLSLVVHARRALDPPAALAGVRDRVMALGEELGLEVHPGSGVLEVRLRGYDKAGALRRLAADHGAALFLGDDLGDVPALHEVRAMRTAGRFSWGVAVLSSGIDEVAAAADVTVPDANAAVALLAALGTQ